MNLLDVQVCQDLQGYQLFLVILVCQVHQVTQPYQALLYLLLVLSYHWHLSHQVVLVVPWVQVLQVHLRQLLHQRKQLVLQGLCHQVDLGVREVQVDQVYPPYQANLGFQGYQAFQ